MGLESQFISAHPNWIGYNGDGSQILATFSFANKAVAIDRATGKVHILCDDLIEPHGVVPYKDGYLITDSRNGRVLRFDNNFVLQEVISFANLPFNNGENFVTEWTQYSSPLSDGNLIATVDSRRATVYVWNPETHQYSTYPYQRDWFVQAVLPIQHIPSRLQTEIPPREAKKG